MSEHAKNRGRMAIYAMAGVYLLFMAYNLKQGLPTSSGNEKIIMIVFMIFFALVGGGMVILGIVQGYRMARPGNHEELPESGEPEDEAEETEE